ncbi:hypothetical protein ACU686_44725 [Yinghuangia aomiensis]
MTGTRLRPGTCPVRRTPAAAIPAAAGHRDQPSTALVYEITSVPHRPRPADDGLLASAGPGG